MLQVVNCVSQQRVFDVQKATHKVGTIGVAVKAASPTECVLKCNLKSRVGFFQQNGGKCFCLTNNEVESQILIGGEGERSGGVDTNNGYLYQQREMKNECPQKG